MKTTNSRRDEKQVVYKAELPLYAGNPEIRSTTKLSWKNLLLYATLASLGLLCHGSLKEFISDWCPTALSASRVDGPAYPIRAESGAVASENKICSDIGVKVLQEGGNAIDAAIAATFCVGVANMFSSGIGGGGFMTVRVPNSDDVDAESQVWTVDFRETAPARANKTMFIGDPNSSMFGGLSVGVPGELRGLEEAHRRWGKLEWKRLVQPSVELATGWTVSAVLARRIRLDDYRSLMLMNPDWSKVFAPEGRLLEEGEIIRRTNYSRTLAAIAAQGPDAFYNGPIADSIVEKIHSEGGILSHEDLRNYSVIVKPALKGSYLGRKVYTTHAPTSGPMLLHMLNVMEHYDLTGEGFTGLNAHRSVEAMKFGFAARTRVSDPAFAKDVEQIEMLSTKEFGDLIAANITDDTTHSPDYYNPEFDVPTDHGTSHTSVVDKDGMAVSITSTINLQFGSLVMDPDTGIILNDEMDDFSTPGSPNAFGLYPSPYNYPEPGKRPLSSTAPTIMENPDGSFYLAIGGSGGAHIFGAVFQVILNLDWGLDVGESIEHGRLHDQLYPNTVDAEDVYPAELLDALRERGHNVTLKAKSVAAAVVQGVVKSGDYIWAASDSRKGGIAAGY